MGRVKIKKSLLLGYTVLVLLLAVDLLVFYRFVFTTGNVALSIELGNKHSSNLEIVGFIASVFILAYFVYHYFIKDEIKL